MGHKAQFLRGQRDAARRRHDRHAVAAKSHRAEAGRSTAGRSPATKRDVPAAVVHPVRPFPSPAQQALLLQAPADAARLQPSASDLLRVLRALLPAAGAPRRAGADSDAAAETTTAASASPKRNRTEGQSSSIATERPLVDKDVTAQALFDALKPEWASLLVDDVASRVVEAFIRGGGQASASPAVPAADRALCEEAIDAVFFAVGQAAVDDEAANPADAGTSDPKHVIAQTVAEADDEGNEFVTAPLAAYGITDLYALATHAVGRTVVWAMIECGSPAQQKRINRALAAECLNLATDRHGVHSVVALLEHYPNSRKTIAPALMPILASTLLPDPAGAKAADALLAPSTAAAVADALGKDAIIAAASSSALEFAGGETKRTLRFIGTLLTQGLHHVAGEDATQAAARAEALVMIAGALQPRLLALATDALGNFTVQALLKALASWGPTHAVVGPAMQQATNAILKSKSPSVVDLATHHIGAHVTGCIAQCAAPALGNALRPHLLKLASDKNGGIALRRLVEQAGAHAEAVATAMLQAMGQHIGTFIADEHGNLVLQGLLRAVKPAERGKFYATHIKANLLEYAQHNFASHVVHALVNGGADGAPLDAASLTALFGQLKRNLVDLAQHINGRFVTEALIAPFRDAQVALIEGLPRLAAAQGTQGVIVKLYDVCDAANRKKIASFVGDNLASLATSKQGSLVVQKLMNRDAETAVTSPATPAAVTEAVRAALKSQRGLVDALRSDFFGRFVVQIAEGKVPTTSSSTSRPAPSAQRGRGGGGAMRGGRGGRGGRGAGRH